MTKNPSSKSSQNQLQVDPPRHYSPIDPSQQLRSVVVCCTLRSGSNLLCELLQRLGYGQPAEFFQANRYANVYTRRDGSAAELPGVDSLYEAFAERHSGEQWRGAKWNYAQFATFRSTIASEGTHRDFAEWFPNPAFIRLTRRSGIDQAVSMVIAKHSNRWASHDKTAIQLAPAYDFDAIWREFADFAVEEALWACHFARLEMPQISVVYEDLIANYAGEMRRILGVIDPAAVDRVAPEDCMPSDVQNQKIVDPALVEFSERFEADLAANRHRQAQVEATLEKLVNAYTNRSHETLLGQLLGQHAGFHSRMRKLKLAKEVRFAGPHQFVSAEHFLDGVAVCIDAGGTGTLTVKARRVMIKFLSHPWSGRVDVAHGDILETIDLYGVTTTTRPLLIEFPRTQRVTIKLSAVGEKSSISNGVEVWLQRIWVVED